MATVSDPVVPDAISAVIATTTGIQLWQFNLDQYQQLTWSREASQVTKATLTIPTPDDYSIVQVQPWLHELTIWDMDRNALLWRGPVIQNAVGRDQTTITAADTGVYMAKTRVPLTKSWDGAYPADVANELWSAMLDMHSITANPVVNVDPFGTPFDYTATRDLKMLNTIMDDLVKLGLRWTVVAGTPVLGPQSLAPLAALTENDFFPGDLQLVADGSNTCNDILLLGPDALGRARVPMNGNLNLQGIATVDNVYSVSNVNKACQQYVRYNSLIRTSIGTNKVRLRPEAPLNVGMLIPSTRVTVEAFGVLNMVEIDSLDVTVSSTGTDVQLGLEPTNDYAPELTKDVSTGSL